MHSPETVAFEIYLGKKKKENGGYRDPLITIWHIDPEKDGTDDSCGWFIRLRHANQDIYEKIVKEFDFNWDKTFKSSSSGFVYNSGWFNPEGENMLSVQGIVINMYLWASKIHYSHNDKVDAGTAWDKSFKFLNKNWAQIMYFAENITDSMRDVILRKYERGCNEPYTPDARDKWIRNCASIIYTDFLRRERRWYQHPKWHVHHWKIQFHSIQNLKRRYWDKCCVCGKRGFKGAAIGDWCGTKIWHEECDGSKTKNS